MRAALRGVHRDSHRHRSGHHGVSRRLLYVLPTGGGKTAVYSMIAAGAAAKNKRILILEHRKELIKQASVALARIGARHRVIAPDDKIAYCRRENLKETGQIFVARDAEIAVASVQTLARRMAWLREFAPDIVITDEAHHAVAGTWLRISEETEQAVHIGVTATPCRTNGQGLGDVYQTMVLGPTPAELTDDGYLLPCRVFAPSNVNTDGVPIRGGDLDPDAQAELLSNPQIIGCAVEHYAQHCPGEPAIVFACNRKHAEIVAQQFRDAGWRFHRIDGSMDDSERDRLMAGLADGSVQGLVSVDLISEGTDIPCATAAFMLRRTLSESLYLQMAGRVLRPVYARGHDLDTLEGRLAAIEAGGKPAGLLFDHVGNWLRHGRPHDHREWSLDGRRPRRRVVSEDEEREDCKQCPKCYAVHDPAPVCPYCGHVYEVKRKAIAQKDGELVEIAETPEEIARREERRRQGMLKTKRDMVSAGINGARADHILAARAEKDRLRSELRELVRKNGNGPSAAEIWEMKPKALREWIDRIGGDLFMGKTG